MKIFLQQNKQYTNILILKPTEKSIYEQNGPAFAASPFFILLHQNLLR